MPCFFKQFYLVQSVVSLFISLPCNISTRRLSNAIVLFGLRKKLSRSFQFCGLCLFSLHYCVSSNGIVILLAEYRVDSHKRLCG